MLGSILALASAALFGLNSASIRRGVLTGSILHALAITVPLGVPLFALAYVAFGGLQSPSSLSYSGWVWFAGEGRIQEVLIHRSIRFGVNDKGEVLKNALSFELAQHPELIQLFGILVLAFELGFPLLLLIKSVKLRLAFIMGVTSFHIATFVLMNVNFLLIPFVYLIFFDLVPIHAWLKPRAYRILGRRPAAAG